MNNHFNFIDEEEGGWDQDKAANDETVIYQMTEYSYYVQSSTLHFTNFAILLSSDKKSGFDSSFSWLAFSFIMAAIVVVIFVSYRL